MRPIVITQGMNALIMSNNRLLIQYAVRSIPLINYMCFKFFSLSLRMKLTIDAGISAKPIETTKTMNIPLADACLCLNARVMGNG
jgi:hypothetical protein